MLRDEVRALERSLNETKVERAEKELADVDRWIRELLVKYDSSSENGNGDSGLGTQVLNSVDEVADKLRDGRYSPEQVDKVFERLCYTCPIVGRDSLDRTPLLRLLVEAAGKLDQMERTENPNKRWNGRVERELRKKLFAREWGIDLENTKDGSLKKRGQTLEEAVGRYKDR